MLKNKSKLLTVVFIIMILISSFSLASEPVVTSLVPGDNARTEETPTNENEPLPSDIRNDDLYLFGDNVVMDQLVDGNVYLFGNNIEISGRVNGNLYAFGNKVTFKEGSYAVNSIFVAGNNIELDTQANDVYAFANTINISYNTFIVRDLRVGANNLTFNGCVGRNAFVTADNFNFVTGTENSALVYGDLNYSSNTKLDISSDFVQGNINYEELTIEEDSIGDIIIDKANSLLTSLLFTIVVYLLALWIAPNFVKKASSFASTKVIPAIGIGFLALILIPLACFILLFSTVGISASFALLGLYILILLICSSIVSICIINKVKEHFKLDKKSMTALVLVVTSIVLWALQQIPFIGGWIGFLLAITGLGIMFMYLFTKNKNSSEEVVEVKE